MKLTWISDYAAEIAKANGYAAEPERFVAIADGSQKRWGLRSAFGHSWSNVVSNRRSHRRCPVWVARHARTPARTRNVGGSGKCADCAEVERHDENLVGTVPPF